MSKSERGMMSRVTVGGVRFNVQIDGPEDAPHVTFAHSLATDLRMWEPQVEALASSYRILRYDARGHGSSDVPAPPYSLDDLVGDAVGLLDELEVEKTTLVGLSMGGIVAQGLALEYPSRVRGIVVANSVAEWPEGAEGMWKKRISLAREKGMSAHVQSTLGRWFTAETLEGGGDAVDAIRAQIESTPVEGYIGCCSALSRLDYAPRLPEIAVPVLLVAGREDPATTPEAMYAMHEVLSDSIYVELQAAHLSNIECSWEFTEALISFLS